MPFNDPIVAGTTLVRDAIQSPGYQAGVTGWSINADGTAEFNNITARGNITASGLLIGTNPGNHIASSLAGSSAAFAFYSGDPAETKPGAIGAKTDNSSNPNSFWVSLQSGERGNGASLLNLYPPTTTSLGNIVFGTVNVGVLPPPGTAVSTAATFTNQIQARFLSTGGVGGSDFPALFGDPAAGHTRVAPGQLQAITGGSSVGTLALNPAGGMVTAPSMSAGSATGSGSTSATGFSSIGTVLSGSPYPASGRLRVHVSARISNSQATLGGGISVQIRDSGGGTVRFLPSINNEAFSTGPGTGTGPRIGVTMLATGLPTTGAYEVQIMIRTENVTNTATFGAIEVVVEPSL